jgi:negative regulator of sigma E activity
MSDTIHEQVSKFVDDEMSVEECDFFVRRLERDGDARSRYLRYQLIGAALRREQMASPSAAPAATVTRVAPRWVRVGLAASILFASVLGLVAGDSPLNGPRTFDQARVTGVQTDVTGVQYLLHHMAASTGLNRTLMHSSVFSDIESDTDASTEDREQDETSE